MLIIVCVMLISLSNVACAIAPAVKDYNYQRYHLDSSRMTPEELRKMTLYDARSDMPIDDNMQICGMGTRSTCVVFPRDEHMREKADYLGLKYDLAQCRSELKINGLLKAFDKSRSNASK